MLLKVVDPSIPPDSPEFPSRFKDIIIPEGSMFLLPANTPHNPVRFADTVGIVLEQKRPEGSVDKMRWYCGNEACREIVYEAAFHCTDLGTQIKAAVEDFKADMGKRTCGKCGVVADWCPPEGSIRDPNKTD